MSDEIGIPMTENYVELDKPVIVELLDPDWTDHFPTVDHAFDHYKRYTDRADWLEVLREARGE